MTTLITGAAGFIGSHLAKDMIATGERVVCIDGFSNYYSTDLKEARLNKMLPSNVELFRGNIKDLDFVQYVFAKTKPKCVIHLAAQAGVRVSKEKFNDYVESNILGTFFLLQESLRTEVKEFLFASSSSVYGNSTKSPFSENDEGLKPISFYGATKLFDENMTNPMIRESGMKVVALRFFTVYGPWGRPDMAYFRLATSAVNNIPFRLFGNGEILRDFTWIGDVVKSIRLLLEKSKDLAPGKLEIFNVGGGRPISMKDFISLHKVVYQSDFEVEHLNSNRNDVKTTIASFEKLEAFTGFKPEMDVQSGVELSKSWFELDDIKPNLYRWSKSTV